MTEFERVNPYRCGKLYFLIGLPRAGKSSYAMQFIKGKLDNPRVIINADSFRWALHGDRYHKETEAMVFTLVDYAAKALLLSSHDVLMDETSSSFTTIQRYYRLDPNACGIWIDTPKEVCIKRAKELNQLDLIPVIERIDRQIKELNPMSLNNIIRIIYNEAS